MPSLTSAISSATTAVNNAVSTAANTINNASTVVNSTVSAASAQIAGLAQSGLSNLGTSLPAVAGQMQDLVSALSLQAASRLSVTDISGIVEAGRTKVEVPPERGVPPFPNVLHNYASYNYIFTLSVLSDQMLAFPDETYRKDVLGPIICKSGSGDPDNRFDAGTTGTKNEFYIDNVSIKTLAGFNKNTGNSNSTNITFKVTEIYTMGLFFQTLMLAATEVGYKNYLDVPLLLSIEFMGHIDSITQNVHGDSLVKGVRTTKHLPLKLNNVSMKVTGKGAEYSIEAIPYNEQAYSTKYAELKTDLMMSGSTVHEILQTGEKSLQKVLNDRLKEIGRKNKLEPDQILISFPDDWATGSSTPPGSGDAGATVDPSSTSTSASIENKLGVAIGTNQTLVQSPEKMNIIGKMKMNFNPLRPGDNDFSKDNVVYDANRGIFIRPDITTDPNVGELRFAQGSDIMNIINQVILLSDYGRNAIKKENIDANNKIKWWRIETQMFNIPSDKNITKTGIRPKLIVYRVIPYSADSSVFMSVNSISAKPEGAKQQIIKEYNYIYTGKNLDIIDFNIDIKAGFYKALVADGGKNSLSQEMVDKNANVTPEDPSANVGLATGQEPDPFNMPAQASVSSIGTSTDNKSSGSHETPQSRIARQFHEVLTTNTDMVNLDFKILGDPYYLSDSGVGNYTAKSTNYIHMNADSSADYQNGDLLIAINFRTPLDINSEQGVYSFDNTTLIDSFSGMYKVVECDNIFNKGRFTQHLTGFRLPGQPAQTSTQNQKAPSATTVPGAQLTTGDFARADRGALFQDTGKDVTQQNFDSEIRIAYDDDGNLLPGYELNEYNDPVWVG